MKLYAAISCILFFVSCAPRFTVYVDPWIKVEKNDIAILSIDTISGPNSEKIKIVRYVLKRDVKGIEKAFLRSKLR